MWSEVAGYNFKEYEIQTALNYLFIPNSLSATISILSKIKSIKENLSLVIGLTVGIPV